MHEKEELKAMQEEEEDDDEFQRKLSEQRKLFEDIERNKRRVKEQGKDGVGEWNPEDND